ncbi:hypothetical protein JTB14_011537 [Gonioctena quinquepunctata]|nr:hypothetical protein JTB14_011537 [Gonioctena quinquepunctata]
MSCGCFDWSSIKIDSLKSAILSDEVSSLIAEERSPSDTLFLMDLIGFILFLHGGFDSEEHEGVELVLLIFLLINVERESLRFSFDGGRMK